MKYLALLFRISFFLSTGTAYAGMPGPPSISGLNAGGLHTPTALASTAIDGTAQEDSTSPVSVPEPSTSMLLGLLGLLFILRRRKQ